MGPAVHARIATVLTPPPEARERQLAHGRDLRPGKRQLALSLPGGGFHRRHLRLPSLRQAGRGRSQALSRQSARQSKPALHLKSATAKSCSVELEQLLVTS